MNIKLSTVLVSAALLSVFAVPGNASLLGTSVTGSLTFSGIATNYFDPGNGFVPPGYLNDSGTTVTISNGAVEFGYDDGSNRFTADFTSNGLTITDLVEMSGTNTAYQMSFTDTAFNKQVFTSVSDTLPVTSYSLIGDVITLDFSGGNVTAGQTLADTFKIAAAPEPSTGVLLSIAIFAGILVLCRAKRYRSHERSDWS